ncbi:TPA: DUF87 domain-containing protein [Listeria monocytogenes]|nr:hypothetical protein M639_12120 [Listeria monocytogenes]MCP7252824.1 DUF87 domain-containing protein [Listeria monocytogenes]ODF96621.1 hypothetical protein BB694_11890 [Listeria monocytogenes]OFG77648.1 hypothetical protein BJM75_12300 [Listeria monocytogenes]HDL0062874.1 DUF87 domain-containing protein [Listeria monocytogenes]
MITMHDSKSNKLFVFKSRLANGAVISAPPLDFFHTTIHLSLVSPTGGGKSIAIKLILASIARNRAYKDTEILILDPKNYEYRPFENLANVFLGEKVVDGFNQVYERFERRLNGLESSNNLLLLVIEEYSSLLLHYDKKTQEEIKAKMARLLMMSRVFNIRCIFVMQRFDSAYFTNGSRDNITTRIAFGTLSKESQRMLFPDCEEIEPQPKRHGYFYIDGKGITKIIVPTVRHFEKLDNDIARFLAKNT